MSYTLYLQTVMTPGGKPYHGRMLEMERLVGVSIIRAGVPMEWALVDIVKDIALGKLLIQSDEDRGGEARLYHCSLPSNIDSKYIVLMDATIATGAAAMMAIRVLLDHGVLQPHIFLTVLIASPVGLSN